LFDYGLAQEGVCSQTIAEIENTISMKVEKKLEELTKFANFIYGNPSNATNLDEKNKELKELENSLMEKHEKLSQTE
jgi:hypothetical protein